MEKLHVKDFLVIKEAEFVVGRVNVLIGSQSNGKSLLAKLLYFFREIVYDTTFHDQNSQKLSLFEQRFRDYFPSYTWQDDTFEIIYQIDTTTINVRYFKRQLTIETKSKKSHDTHRISKPIFIPASRSFFATLQQNIFSLLSNDIAIDRFIAKFGSLYEKSKKHFHTKANQKSKKIIEGILNGRYRYEKSEDWIETHGKKINIANASSGQQEALPMLLILSTLLSEDATKFMTFIEEPETHLFPVSQKHIVSIFGILYQHQQECFITTHSPYILTALNNLILAYDVKMQKGAEAINGVIDEEFCIHYNDVKAYTLQDGILKSIMDDESRLIGINIIDAVSDEFNDAFDTLLAMLDT